MYVHCGAADAIGISREDNRERGGPIGRWPVPIKLGEPGERPITLYSSASRLSSMTSEVGNGASGCLPSPLSSDILTVLPDFLPLQRINRGCRPTDYTSINGGFFRCVRARLHSDLGSS